jgi:hypothetical protein
MFDSDQMTEGPELRALRDALDRVDMPARPPLDAITARGRARRRHRVTGPAGLVATGTVAGAALTLGFAAATGHDGVAGGSAASTHRASAAHVLRTPAYTLVSDTSGTVKLTMNPRRLFEPAALQSDLARFGIPAKVTAGRLCTSDPAPAGFRRAVSFTVRRRQTITIDPKAIRPGTELSVGMFRLAIGRAAMLALIDAQRFTCSTSINAASAHGGAMLGYYRLPARRATSHG